VYYASLGRFATPIQVPKGHINTTILSLVGMGASDEYVAHVTLGFINVTPDRSTAEGGALSSLTQCWIQNSFGALNTWYIEMVMAHPTIGWDGTGQPLFDVAPDKDRFGTLSFDQLIYVPRNDEVISVVCESNNPIEVTQASMLLMRARQTQSASP
jgi:hypothetical protein